MQKRIIEDEGLAARIGEIVEPAIEDLGFRLVRVRLSSENGRTLQIMAERPDGTMTIEGCTLITKTISPLLDAEDPIDSTYHLEVSSPGVDRPLVRLEDFARHQGLEAKLELKQMRDRRKRFRGFLAGVREDEVGITLSDTGEDDAVTYWLSGADIRSAKLVMNDSLLAFAQSNRLIAPLPDFPENGEEEVG